MHIRPAPVLVMMMAMLAASCASTRPSPTHVDHVILGVSDLDAGVREFEALTGVHAVFGGKHPGRGTQNALVSLGAETYLEIIAPQPGATPEGFGELLKLEHLTPVGWAVFAPDVATVRAELGAAGIQTSEPRPGSRATPAGATLHWSTFELVEPKLETAPFFIHWDDLAVHPAKTTPGGCTLERLEVGEAGIERLLDALHLNVQKTRGAPVRLTLHCGERTLSFPR